MSSITGLISGGGGGGETHIKTDPRQMTRVASEIFRMRASTSGDINSTQDNFFIGASNSAHFATVEVNASNTYYTLLNASNANGGYLYWVLSPGILTGSVTIKIAIDGGTAYEFNYNRPATAVSRTRMFMGGALSARQVNDNVWIGQSGYGIATSFESRAASLWDDVSNKVYGLPTLDPNFIYSDFSLLEGTTFERLKFESSINIQCKMSNRDATQNNWRALCFYTLK